MDHGGIERAAAPASPVIRLHLKTRTHTHTHKTHPSACSYLRTSQYFKATASNLAAGDLSLCMVTTLRPARPGTPCSILGRGREYPVRYDYGSFG
jgi:hypothetical protein